MVWLIYACRSVAAPANVNWTALCAVIGTGYKCPGNEAFKARKFRQSLQLLKMAPVSTRSRRSIILKIIDSKRKRRKEQQRILFLLCQQQRILKVMIIAGLFLLARQQVNTVDRFRSCRRLLRNHGWWDNVWSSYSNKWFKNCFSVSRQTFLYLLEHLRNDLEKVSLTEDRIPPECRLAICLFRLGRGDYYHTISELTGLGTATVCNITLEVSKAIVK